MEISTSSEFLRRVISPAIRGQTCPICLGNLHGRTSAVLEACNHAYCETCIAKWSRLRRNCPLCNAAFDSWLSPISFSAGTFRRHRLPAAPRRAPRRLRFREGESYRSRRFVNDSVRKRRTTPLPWRRSFGRSGDVGVVARRKLQWRESIYEGGLKAVPLSSIDRREQNALGSSGSARERVSGRIEPWIRRELQAILKDPDPSVIVHVASSACVAVLEKKAACSSELANAEGRFLAELRPFLLDKTEMFWHELRCFAESTFTMETYDSVVEYRVVCSSTRDCNHQ